MLLFKGTSRNTENIDGLYMQGDCGQLQRKGRKDMGNNASQEEKTNGLRECHSDIKKRERRDQLAFAHQQRNRRPLCRYEELPDQRRRKGEQVERQEIGTVGEQRDD